MCFMLLNIKSFVNGVQKEFNRISWPTFQETKMTTIAVLILAVIMSMYFVVVDQVIFRVLAFILGAK